MRMLHGNIYLYSGEKHVRERNLCHLFSSDCPYRHTTERNMEKVRRVLDANHLSILCLMEKVKKSSDICPLISLGLKNIFFKCFCEFRFPNNSVYTNCTFFQNPNLWNLKWRCQRKVSLDFVIRNYSVFVQLVCCTAAKSVCILISVFCFSCFQRGAGWCSLYSRSVASCFLC